MENYKNLSNKKLSAELNLACGKNNLELVKYLLKSPDLKIHPKIECSLDSCFFVACRAGSLDVVKYLLSSETNLDEGTMEFFVSWGCLESSTHNKLNILDYLLNLGKLDLTNDSHAEGILELSCQQGHLEIVRYLLETPQLKEHFHKYVASHFSNGFEKACEFNQLEILKYFIFDLNIPKNENINTALEKYKKHEIENFFKLREINDSLKTELGKNLISDKKNKI